MNDECLNCVARKFCYYDEPAEDWTCEYREAMEQEYNKINGIEEEQEHEHMRGKSMSILIKGLNMPKDDGIVITIEPNGEVYVQTQEGFSFFASKTKAVEVLTPHGRLIDADFMKELGAKCIAVRCDDGVLLALGRIDDLPTVIEAEE